MIEWIVIVGLVVAMYIVIYKYEKKMDNLDKIVQENREKLELHCDKITKNREHIDKNYAKVKEHDNHIDKMWVTIPKIKEES